MKISEPSSNSSSTSMKPTDYCKNDAEYLELCRQLTAEFVDNLIKMASEEAAIRIFKNDLGNNLPESRPTNLTPSIQIDLIGSRTPSPEEETFPWVEQARHNGANHIDYQQNDPIKQEVDEKPAASILQKTEKPEDRNIVEIRMFAATYVKNIISKAIILASEREPTYPSLKSELSQPQITHTSNLSWLERIREILRRFIARACLCKTKHTNSTDSFKDPYPRN